MLSFKPEEFIAQTAPPAIAAQATDFADSSPEVLANIVDPRCNRVRWRLDPTHGLTDFLADMRRDDGMEKAYRTLFAQYPADKDCPFDVKTYKHTKFPLVLANGQELEVSLDETGAKGAAHLVPRLAQIADSICAHVDGKVIFDTPNLHFLTSIEASRDRARAKFLTPRFHRDGFKPERLDIQSSFTVLDNHFGERSRAVNAPYYPGILRWANIKRNGGGGAGEAISAATDFILGKERFGGGLASRVFDYLPYHEINLIARGDVTKPADEREQERVYCVHASPERNEGKRAHMVWHGYVLKK